jgi:uracil-DNA glycosylase
VLAAAGWALPRPRPVFGHGARVPLRSADGTGELLLLGSYHPSRRNVSTRTVTPAMIGEVLRAGAVAAGLPVREGPP